MTRNRLGFPIVLAIAAAVAACSDTTSVMPPPPAGARPDVTAAECSASPSDIRTRLQALYPNDDDLEATALAKFSDVQKKVGEGKLPAAVTKMFGLIDWTLQNYRAGTLVGGQRETTRLGLTGLIGKLYCYVRLPAPSLSAAALEPDAAVAVVYPTSIDTLIKTATDWAEVFIPAGAIPGNQPVLITIQRIPESQFITPSNPFAGPLVTNLNQYPLYYQYDVSPAVTFNIPVSIGICLEGVIDLNNPPGSRLRVAHNVTPTIEILPLAPPPALNCNSIVTASAATGGPTLAQGAGWMGGLRLGLERATEWLLPRRLEAAMFGPIVRGTCCLGGTTRTFSPFGGVDTLGFHSALSATNQTAPAGSPVPDPPRVLITTDPAQGAQPIAGVTVTFSVVAGGGTLNGGQSSVAVLTGTNGEASVASWVVGQGANQVVATPSYVPGTGFTPASVVFNAIGTLCQAQTQIPALQCNALAALYTSTNGANWTTKTGWLQTATPCSWFGIVCVGGVLTDIILANNNLSGSIPVEIGDLTDLEFLGLNSNQLTGAIPASLGNLSNLLFLQLQSNQLSGAIPASLGNLNSLFILALESNQLSGAIPTSLGNLTAVQTVNLSGNQLTGTIPASLGGLPSLQQLYLYSNQLSGTVPLAVAVKGGALQGTGGNQSNCQLQGNAGLHVPDQPAYRAADLNGDGAICGLTFTTVATVDVAPIAPTISVSATLQFTATLRDIYGNVLSGPLITWSSTNAAVATVNSTGLATGVAIGSAVIRATSQAVNGVATLTVN